MRTPDQLVEAFRGQGLKMTPQRQLIFRLLHGNALHPSAESLFAAASVAMPGISLRTVYQTLNDLVAMGELRLIDLGGPARFDPNVTDHHHAVCRRCGTIIDVALAEASPSIDGAPGFDIEHTDVVFHGVCNHCAA